MNCALDCPDATTTLGATVTFPFPLARPTVIALAAAAVRLTVHCVVPGAFTVPGAQLSELNCAVADTVTVAVWVCAPLVAITVTVCVLTTVLAVAVKVAVLDPAPTVTLAGTVSAALLLDSPIVIALAAALLKLTVQVDDEPAPTEFGEQLSPLNCAGAALTFNVKVCDAPPRLAVRTAV